MKQITKSSRLNNVRYDVRGPVVQKAAQMEAAGESIIKLNIGNPASFGITGPQSLCREMGGKVGQFQAYSDSKGLRFAREAIRRYGEKKGLPNIDENLIYTGNGVSELIQICMNALLNTGDEILIPSPDYPLWTAAATMAGGKVVHYICDEKSCWYPDLNDIEKKITAATKAIVIINPNNPTGALYPKELLVQIVEIARKYGLIILADEIYDRLLLDDREHVSIASLAPDLFCITMNGLSKSHMFCGYRVGWMILSGDTSAASDLIDGLNMLTNMRLCANAPGQSVIPAALEGAGRAEEHFVSGGRIRNQVDLAVHMLNAIPGVSAARPSAAFYIFPGIDRTLYPLPEDEAFALDLLQKEKVLIVPGSGFNWRKPGYFRVVCLPEEKMLAEAINRFEHYLRTL